MQKDKDAESTFSNFSLSTFICGKLLIFSTSFIFLQGRERNAPALSVLAPPVGELSALTSWLRGYRKRQALSDAASPRGRGKKEED